MKKLVLTVLTASVLLSCGPKVNDLAISTPIQTSIDLTNVKEDKVMVEVDPGRFTSETVNFYIPKTVPGTYSDNDYGQFIEGFTALDYNGKPLKVSKADVNTWSISNAKNLDKVTYWVNDSFDTEKEVETAVFSPAGTNIEAGKNFFMNLHMFVGYFDNLGERPYILNFKRPEGFVASTSLEKNNAAKAIPGTDVFYANRYFEVTDNPIMYSAPDSESFTVSGIEVTLSVYSPNKVYSALSIKDDMERMMKAQKAFLGDINATKKYHILLYLSTLSDTDATGFGALEHHTSTTVVLPETMPKEALTQTMIDVVSHEFFHIVTPLTVHSEEVHYFNYNHPKMSKHLWMYEGVTEYFANLFQIQQGLIDEPAFYERIMGKVEGSKRYDDAMSFTVMSENILVDPYKPNYANVYEKGALIGMCVDLIIREKSNGEKGILWLMKQLSARYGKDKPFKDNDIIAEITSLTYPEVGEFFQKHVIGDTPIDYNTFLAKVGLEFRSEMSVSGYFLHNQQIPYIDLNQKTNEIFFRKIPLNTFLTSLGVEGGDVLVSLNGEPISIENIRNVIFESFSWETGKEIDMVIKRGDEELTLNGKTIEPQVESSSIVPVENTSQSQLDLRNAWMKN